MTHRSLFLSLCLILGMISSVHAEGFAEFSVNKFKSGESNVTSLEVGQGVKNIQLLGYFQTSPGNKYGQVSVGHSVELTEGLTVTPYVGIEALTGFKPKLRGIVITEMSYHDWNVFSQIEFGGNTGNFNFLRIGYTWSNYTLSAVRNSNDGHGARLDWKIASNMKLFAEALKKRTSVGVSYEF